MNFNIKNIYDKLLAYSPVLLDNYYSSTYLKEVKLLYDEQTNFYDSILYLGKASITSKLEINKANLVLINDSQSSVDYLSKLNLNIILLNEKTDLFKIFNELQDIFSANYKFIESSAEILNSLIKGKGLEYIIQIGNEIIGNPIALIDSSFKLLSCTKSNVKDPIWQDMVMKGFMSYKTITAFKNEKIIEKVEKSDLPILVYTGIGENIRRILGKVSINNKTVGYIAVLEYDKKFKDEDIQLISLLADVISSEMQKNKFLGNFKGVMYENLIIDLLNNYIKQEDVLLERIKSTNLNLSKNLYLMTIKLPKGNTIHHLTDYIRDYIENLIPNSKSVFYEENIIIIIDLKNKKTLSKGTLDKLKIFLIDNYLCAAISSNFSTLLEVKKYYNQSVSLLHLGKIIDNQNNLFIFNEMKIYHLLNSVYEHENLIDYCNPALKKLLKYDKQNGTNYYDTLYVYLANDRNLRNTADKLFIHRNTMAYRLSKIEKISEINLKDGNQTFDIFLSYKINF